MLIDANTVTRAQTIEADVCIVGAGAAGITLAREFVSSSFQVCLLESGGLNWEEKTQSLYKGQNVGRPYFPLHISRLRYFGGTTNHWAGWCRPLDEIDFEERDWIPYSGWPFTKADLDPFYERAQSICQLGPFLYDAEDWEIASRTPLPFSDNRISTKIFQLSPPTRFGVVYQKEISEADNITTYINANVVDIETNKGNQAVTRLTVACLGGNQFWVSAKTFILALGAIENARLLLVSNKKQKEGLGNQHDLVGRFFAEHPHLESGILLLSQPDIPIGLYLQQESVSEQSVPIVGVLTLSKETLRREKLANYSATLEPTSWSKASKGFTSFRALVRGMRQMEIPDDFTEHLKNVIVDIDDVASALYNKLSKQSTEHMLYVLYNRTEQVPNPDSRMTLSNEKDALGMRRVALDWHLSEIDTYSIKRAHEIIGKALGLAGLGRIKITFDDDVALLAGGWHHMGTTRMHLSPKQGVVDENSKVHGLANLFITGSSVFPTVGCANPTLTIVALALRLADHVKAL